MWLSIVDRGVMVLVDFVVCMCRLFVVYMFCGLVGCVGVVGVVGVGEVFVVFVGVGLLLLL